MKKNTCLKSAILLAIFVGCFLSVPIVSAAKPTTTHRSYNGFPSAYYPGETTPLGKSSMIKVSGRMSQFDIDGFGTFTSVEDSVVDSLTGVGTTHGTITVTNGPFTILIAESNGKVFPTYILDKSPVLGFQGHFNSIGDSNIMHVNGEYSGYFTPTGSMHMEISFQSN